jgi:hypothetical protein
MARAAPDFGRHGPTTIARLAAILLLAIAGFTLCDAPAARALPSFALQTGQQCVACHNGYPELTPYGRQFKLNGYTLSSINASSLPLAMVIIATDTHTQKAAPAPVIPGTSRNDNLVMDAANVYLAGRLTSNVGAFVQALWSPLTHRLQIFTADVRYANSTRVLGKDLTYGVSVNNNPGVSDPWNTAGSFWSYPYEMSHVVGGPDAGTAIQGRYALEVVGANTYLSWNRLLYADVGAYRSLTPSTLNSIGVNTRGFNPIDGIAPYWRVAVEPAWGHSTLEFGTFGLALSAYPRQVTRAGTDRTVDVGFDGEYQYLENRNSLSLIGSYIHESASMGASRALGFATNGRDVLDAVNVKATYYYDQKYGGNIGYFQTTGTRDRDLYGAASAAGSPDTAGWIMEADYYPFNRDGPVFWRKLNLKFGLQYTYYTRFNGGTSNYDGAGRSAADKNTLFLYTWTSF